MVLEVGWLERVWLVVVVMMVLIVLHRRLSQSSLYSSLDDAQLFLQQPRDRDQTNTHAWHLGTLTRRRHSPPMSYPVPVPGPAVSSKPFKRASILQPNPAAALVRGAQAKGARTDPRPWPIMVWSEVILENGPI
jgi:hypothetical protein